MGARRDFFLTSLVLGTSFAALACGQGKMASGPDAASGGAPASTGGRAGGMAGTGGAPMGDGGTAGNDPGSGGFGGRVARDPVRHRAEAVTCDMNPAPTAATCSPVGSEGAAASTCSSDAQCTAGVNGRCIQYALGETLIRCRCTYTECHSDQDCSSGGSCRCGGTGPDAWGNTCLEGNCRVDADCGPGGFCSPTRRRSALASEADKPTAVAGTYCHTPTDECIEDSDCLFLVYGPSQCAYDEGQRRWNCIPYVGP